MAIHMETEALRAAAQGTLGSPQAPSSHEGEADPVSLEGWVLEQ